MAATPEKAGSDKASSKPNYTFVGLTNPWTKLLRGVHEALHNGMEAWPVGTHKDFAMVEGEEGFTVKVRRNNEGHAATTLRGVGISLHFTPIFEGERRGMTRVRIVLPFSLDFNGERHICLGANVRPEKVTCWLYPNK